MRIFKKQVTIEEAELFDKKGEFNLTKELANMLDTILLLLIVEKQSDLYSINLELRRCGFFIIHPDLKKVVKKMIKQGMIFSPGLSDKLIKQ